MMSESRSVDRGRPGPGRAGPRPRRPAPCRRRSRAPRWPCSGRPPTGLAEAHRDADPLLRYPAAYLAALRAGAAVLAVRGPPGAQAPGQPQRVAAAGRGRAGAGRVGGVLRLLLGHPGRGRGGHRAAGRPPRGRRPAAPVRAVRRRWWRGRSRCVDPARARVAPADPGRREPLVQSGPAGRWRPGARGGGARCAAPGPAAG